MDESINKAGWDQLAILVCYVDSIIHEPKEELVCIPKLSLAKTKVHKTHITLCSLHELL